jgi:hypothetical protein
MWSKVLLNNKMICIRLFFSNVLMVKFNVGLWFNHRKYFRISTGAICSEFPQELFGQNFPRSYLVRISTGAIWSEFPQELFGQNFPRSYLVRISTGAIWSEFPQELFGQNFPRSYLVTKIFTFFILNFQIGIGNTQMCIPKHWMLE